MSDPLAEAFSMIEQAAAARQRCPTNDALPQGATTMLARQGKIRIEVYPHNWRVVEILAGPQAGKRTAGPPEKSWQPYLIVDAQGSRYVVCQLTEDIP